MNYDLIWQLTTALSNEKLRIAFEYLKQNEIDIYCRNSMDGRLQNATYLSDVSDGILYVRSEDLEFAAKKLQAIGFDNQYVMHAEKVDEDMPVPRKKPINIATRFVLRNYKYILVIAGIINLMSICYVIGEKTGRKHRW